MIRLRKALPRWQAARTTILSLSGFGLLSAAAATVDTGLGLAAAGISLLIVEFLSEDDQ